MDYDLTARRDAHPASQATIDDADLADPWPSFDPANDDEMALPWASAPPLDDARPARSCSGYWLGRVWPDG
jgi:hypothetical protein